MAVVRVGLPNANKQIYFYYSCRRRRIMSCTSLPTPAPNGGGVDRSYFIADPWTTSVRHIRSDPSLIQWPPCLFIRVLVSSFVSSSSVDILSGMHFCRPDVRCTNALHVQSLTNPYCQVMMSWHNAIYHKIDENIYITCMLSQFKYFKDSHTLTLQWPWPRDP